MAIAFCGGIFPGSSFQHLESRPGPAAQRLNRRLTPFSSASAPEVFKRVLQTGLQLECPGSFSPLLLAERTNLGVEAKAICYSPSLPQACRWVRAVADTEAAMPRLLQHRPELQRVYSKCSLPMGWRSWPWGRPGCGPRQRRTDACPYQRLRAALPQMLRLFCKPDFKD